MTARPCCRFTSTSLPVRNAAASSSEQPAKPAKPEKAALDFTTAGRPKGGKLAKVIRDSIKVCTHLHTILMSDYRADPHLSLHAVLPVTPY